MKCEYCDNELLSGGAEVCPHCGASLASNKLSSATQASDGGCSIDVVCPHCQSVYEITPNEYGESRECELCHESFALISKSLSSLQSNLVWKARIAGIVDQWRHGNDSLFSARQCAGNVLLRPGEMLYEQVDDVVLSETRGVRRTNSERSSHRNYEHDHWDARMRRTGEHYNYQGHSETATEYEYRNLDKGVLYLTSRRLLFVGNQMQRYVNLDRILSFVPDMECEGEIRISEESKQKVLRFSSYAEDKYDELLAGDYDTWKDKEQKFFRFSLVLKALRDADFKRFLMTAPTDDVATYFMNFPPFQELKPQPPQVMQPVQENETSQEWSGLNVFGAIVIVFGIARIISSLAGTKLTVVLTLLLVAIGFTIYKTVKD